MRLGYGVWVGVMLAVLQCAVPVLAQTASPYRASENWLCRPGRADLCSGDLAATRVAADGSMTREPWAPDPAAPIDCFYVYPTVSEDPNGNSPLLAGPGERRAVEQQFARFAAVCRPFAPLYRQITLAGLRSYFTGGSLALDPEQAYGDVLAAWRDYLQHDNQGRGVVLIGHSQGARMLTELLQREIEGKPAQSLLVSALLIGSNIEVPVGKRKGGTFDTLELCASAAQTGCVLSYVSFRERTPPPAKTLFGRPKILGMEVACTDPAALDGGELRSYFRSGRNLIGQAQADPAWTQMTAKAATPYVALPGLLSARCVREGGAAYLAIGVRPAAQDARPADIPGDLVLGGELRSDWGLHLVDMDLAAGNLLSIVRRQGAAFVAARTAATGK